MNTPLCLPPDMGFTEVTHSGLCAAFNLIFEQGQERRCEFELTHVKNYLFCVLHVGHTFDTLSQDYVYLCRVATYKQ